MLGLAGSFSKKQTNNTKKKQEEEEEEERPHRFVIIGDSMWASHSRRILQ